MPGSSQNPRDSNTRLLQEESGEFRWYEDCLLDSEVLDALEVNWLSLTNEWQVPEFWPQENTYEFLPELFQKNTEWKHFALRRFLELALIRARIAFVLRVPGRCPQSIELVTEIGCPLPKTYHELVSFCERAIPESWNRVDPMIGLNLLGVRLTDGGLEGKVAMLAATDFAEAERRQLRRLYFTENCVSFIGKEPGGVAKRYKNFREVIGAYVAQGWEISDVQPLSVAQPNLHLATFYDKKEIFTGRDFCEEDWCSGTESLQSPTTEALRQDSDKVKVLKASDPKAKAFMSGKQWCTAEFALTRFGIKAPQLTKASTKEAGLYAVVVDRMKCETGVFVYHFGSLQLLRDAIKREK